ncbi:MAG: hypothetical protein GY845_25785 [Planctomycetes bacterium]|nr:hypothetical protein [Planctomycetota bacterium]
MMAKALKIIKCDDCTHIDWADDIGGHDCSLMSNKTIINIFTIPDWCPLSDWKEDGGD